jgi:hypothetical protein
MAAMAAAIAHPEACSTLSMLENSAVTRASSRCGGIAAFSAAMSTATAVDAIACTVAQRRAIRSPA